MMKNNRLMVDIDGVLSDTDRGAEDYASAVFGVQVDSSKATSFDWTAWSGLSLEQVKQMFQDGTLYRYLAPYQGAIEGLNNLKEAGFEIYLVTSRPNNESVRAYTLNWLVKHNVSFDGLIFVESSFKNRNAKRDVVKKLDLELAIDDCPEHVLSLAGVCNTVYIPVRPYNFGRSRYRYPMNVCPVTGLAHMSRRLIGLLPLIEQERAIKQRRAA